MIAQEIALRHCPGASATSVALERADGALTYATVLSTGAEVRADGASGKIVADRLAASATETPTSVLASRARQQSRAGISTDEVVAAAKCALPDAGEVRKVELEIDGAQLLDMVDLGRHGVCADARTGDVAEIDRRVFIGR